MHHKAKLIGLFSVLLILSSESYAQYDSALSAYRTQYAVPDAPAFKVLGAEPGNIMRPSSTREVGVAAANFFINGSHLPSAFAAEFSPYLMIGGNSLTLRSYQRSWIDRTLYHTRISIASQRSSETGNTKQVAGGIRATLLDNSDLRLDEEYIKKLYGYSDSIKNLTVRIRDHIRGPTPVFILKPQREQDSLNVLVEASIAERTHAVDSSIVAEREAARGSNWNKPIVELGLALAGSSGDSVGVKGIVASTAALWLVGAGEIGSWGQWILGASAKLERDSLGHFERFEGPLAIRGYAGENSYKAYLQAEANWIGPLPNRYLAELGGEADIYAGLWVEFAIGVEKREGTDPVLTSKFNVRLGSF